MISSIWGFLEMPCSKVLLVEDLQLFIIFTAALIIFDNNT